MKLKFPKISGMGHKQAPAALCMQSWEVGEDLRLG